MRLPVGPWRTVVGFLAERSGDVDGVWRRVAAGEVRLADGERVTGDTPYLAGAVVFLYRDLPVEQPVPGELTVLYRDDRLVVVDKPHFLATMPRGRHVVQTVLVKARRELGLPDLQPAHRLDRLTAGVLVLVVRRQDRAAVQSLFADGRVDKEYLAVAPVRPGLALPVTVRNRLVKRRGVLQVSEEPGEPNAETRVELVAERHAVGGYRLTPTTGRTHQLRSHLAGLGIPILGDPLYPVLAEAVASGREDRTTPLQLLARSVAFTDPWTGRAVEVTSAKSLSAWPAD